MELTATQVRNIELLGRFLSAPVLECPQCGEGYLDLNRVGLSACERCGWTNTKQVAEDGHVDTDKECACQG